MTPQASATQRRATRRATAVAVAVVAVIVLAAGSSPEETAQAKTASATRSATAPGPLVLAGGKTPWKPSANARLSTTRRGADQTVRLTPKRSAGRRTISMTSRPSVTVVARAGTTVSARARLRTSQPGRRLTLRIVELKGGRIVSSRSKAVRPSTRGWRQVSVTLRTTRPGSRIRLVVQAKRVRGRQVTQLTGLALTARARSTDPTAPTGPTSCADIDYSDPAQGVRTFTEEFDGTAIDRNTWRVRDNTFLNQDKAWITKDAVTVHDGMLDIAGKRLPVDQWKYNANGLYPQNLVRDYSTGYIDTMDGAGYGNQAGNRFGQKYGHFEMRAWVPSEATMSRGIWPAFWLRADHQPGEIDPMESYGGPTIRNFDPSSSYEWNSWADTSQGSTNEPNKQMTQGRADVGDDLIWQGWHTYGVNWSPTCLRYLYDGRTVGIVDFDAPTTKPYFRGPTFDDTFHIRLNMQIGSNYWGWPDPAHTRPEFNYRIDWVRVHQRKDLPSG